MSLRAPPLSLLVLLAAIALAANAAAAGPGPLQPMDVFELQWATDPQVSPDGRHVAYVRQRGDVMKDAYTGEIWLVSADGREQRPLA
jgi:hypothetical protein